MKYLLILLSSLLVACTTTEMLPEQSTEVTSIRIINSDDKRLVKAIDDPALIEQVLAFINSLDNAWQESSFGEPNDRVEIRLLNDGKFVGNFRIGEDFFGRDHRINWVQSASEQKLANFSSLLGVDFQLIQVIKACEYDVRAAVAKKLEGAGLSRKLGDEPSSELKSRSNNWCQVTLADDTYRVHDMSQATPELYVEHVTDKVQFYGPYTDIPKL